MVDQPFNKCMQLMMRKFQNLGILRRDGVFNQTLKFERTPENIPKSKRISIMGILGHLGGFWAQNHPKFGSKIRGHLG